MTEREYGLGRVYVPDERDRAFRMAAPLSGRVFRNWLVPGPVDDQGSTSQCVAYSWSHFLRAHRVFNRLNRPQAELYVEAQRADQWPGEEPTYEGTSVRAGAKVLQRWGYLGAYTWAWDAATVAQHILEVGPAVVGTDWTYKMFTPDRDGYIWPEGGNAGGHAYLLTGVHMERKNPDGSTGVFYLQNSWGPGWGSKGRARIAIHAMDALIKAQGEACTATELKVAA